MPTDHLLSITEWERLAAEATGWAAVSGWRIALVVVLFAAGLKIGRVFIRRSLEFSLRAGQQDALRDMAIAKRRNTLIHLFNGVFTALLIVLAVLMIFRELRFEIAPLLASAGIAGVAIGFGAQSLVRDVLNGVFIIIERQFDVGDVVKIGDAAGLVEEVNLRTTLLRDLSGTVHIIPNGEIKRVSVMTKEWSRLVLDVNVAYATNLEHAFEVIRRVLDHYATDHPETVIETPEILGVENLGDAAITIRALVKTAPIQQWSAGRVIRRLIKEEFEREGIEIPFPQRTVWLRKGQSEVKESV